MVKDPRLNLKKFIKMMWISLESTMKRNTRDLTQKKKRLQREGNVPTKVELERLISKLREVEVKDDLLAAIKNHLNSYESFLKEIQELNSTRCILHE